MESSDWTVLLPQYAVTSPGLLACLAGFIVALFFMRRYPLAAMLAGMAWVLLIGNYLVGPLVYTWLVRRMVQQSWSPAEYGRYITILGLVRTILAAVAYGLLAVAVFVGRGRAQPKPFDPDPSFRDATE